MSRQSSSSTPTGSSSNRDSAISDIAGGFPFNTNSAHRLSLRRESRLGSPESETSSPVYRLYPHQTTNGRRLRAMEEKVRMPEGSGLPSRHHQHRHTDQQHHYHEDYAIGTAIHSPSQVYFPQDSPTINPSSSPVEYFAEASSYPLGSRSQSRASSTRPASSTPRRDVHSWQDFVDFDETPRRERQPAATYTPKGYRPPSSRTCRNSVKDFPAAAPSSQQVYSASQRMSTILPNTVDPGTPDTMQEHHYDAGDRSSADSILSQETSNTSFTNLPPLQTKAPDNSDAQQLEPLIEDDPRSFDLIGGPQEDDENIGIYAIEKRADQMFSDRHLQAIFDDPKLLMKFTSFLNVHRSQSIPVLIYYLDALKAIRAIRYANAIAEALDPIRGLDFTKETTQPTINAALEEKAKMSFQQLVQEDLPAYIAYVWINVVSTSIQRRITGTLAPHLRDASEGLAETFCLSDPSRRDNPIVFASEEFARTTQYGMTYSIGRNCRFLQGPRTTPHSVRRLAVACASGKEHNEVFLNYRRDGSPFMNLLMTAPLMDSKGNVRYFIGAQVDVSGLLKGCNELPGLARLVVKDQDAARATADDEEKANNSDEFQSLTEMFNGTELDTVRKHGGRMHKEYVDDSDLESINERRPRVLLQDTSQDIVDRSLEGHRDGSLSSQNIKEKINGKLEGVYQHYLLVRPAPSLRILFTSPSLRVPGILQSPFLHRIGGSSRVRNDLATALGEGRGVTAKVRWLIKPDEDGDGDGRPRWIHCTPLLGHSGAVGVWMVVLVEEDGYQPNIGSGRRFRPAPPVATNIGGKEWEPERSRERNRQKAASTRSIHADTTGHYPTASTRPTSSRMPSAISFADKPVRERQGATQAYNSRGLPLNTSSTNVHNLTTTGEQFVSKSSSRHSSMKHSAANDFTFDLK